MSVMSRLIKISQWPDQPGPRRVHTGNSHAIAPIQWVPQHRTVRNWDQSFGKLFRVRGKGVERDTRPAQDKSLEARRGHRD